MLHGIKASEESNFSLHLIKKWWIIYLEIKVSRPLGLKVSLNNQCNKSIKIGLAKIMH